MSKFKEFWKKRKEPMGGGYFKYIYEVGDTVNVPTSSFPKAKRGDVIDNFYTKAKIVRVNDENSMTRGYIVESKFGTADIGSLGMH